MRKLHRIPRTARRFITKDISFAAMFITVCPPVLSHGKNDNNLPPAKKACIRQGCEKSVKRKISYKAKYRCLREFPAKKRRLQGDFPLLAAIRRLFSRLLIKACIRQGCEKSVKRKISYKTKYRCLREFPAKKTAARRFSAPRSHPPIIQPFTYICLCIIVCTVTKSRMCREQRSTRPCCSTLRCSRQRILRRVRSHISAQRGSFCCCSLHFRLSL